LCLGPLTSRHSKPRCMQVFAARMGALDAPRRHFAEATWLVLSPGEQCDFWARYVGAMFLHPEGE